MITNDKQYRSTKAAIANLRAAANQSPSADVDPLFAEISRNSLSSQIQELEEAVAIFDRLRSGAITTFAAERLADLPDALIQARIARGMSQKDLGDVLGVKEQQVQRYEAERYRSASLDRLVEISDALGVQIENRASLVGSDALNTVDPTDWRAFPIAEMWKRGWFEDFAGTMAQARKMADHLVPAFLQGGHSAYSPVALHRKSVRSGGAIHEAAIMAWEARVRQVADRDPPPTVFDREAIDDRWLSQLVAFTLDREGPIQAVGHLRRIGISLVIERHLPGTYLDGAALCSRDRHGLVALTLRHDRLDNFWFTLFHEIGHLKLHIGHGEAFAAIFDDTEAPASAAHEQEADFFAQEALLPAAKWDVAVSRFSRTKKAVMTDAKRFGVGPAVIAGRVRREAGDYTLLRTLVGSGDVRRQFGQ